MSAALDQGTRYPTALVTRDRARYWLGQWTLQLANELRKAQPSGEVVMRCEEHVTMAALTIEVLK